MTEYVEARQYNKLFKSLVDLATKHDIAECRVRKLKAENEELKRKLFEAGVAVR